MATTGSPAADPAGALPPPCAAVLTVRSWIDELATVESGVESDAARIELITVLEQVKGAASAAQARVTAAFADSQIAAAGKGSESAQVRRSVAVQIALARREAPDRGAGLVRLAEALTRDLPGTMAALTDGETSEYRAMLLHRETACLPPALRREVDGRIAASLPRLGNRQVGDRAREHAFGLDPEAVAERHRLSVRQRRVTLRRAPDAMAYLTALLPAASATVCHAALARSADTALAAGASDGRGRGQLMADALVQRLTRGLIIGCDEHGAPVTDPALVRPGAADADQDDSDHRDGGPNDSTESPTDASASAGHSAGVSAGDLAADSAGGSLDVHVHLVMTDRTLFGADHQPGQLLGYGPIPAELARRIAAAELGPRARTWIRRLFTEPQSGRLTAMDSHSRLFPDSLKQFLTIRDQHCRMPFCGAPARHADHVVRHADGGPTSVTNGQCTSVNCNQLKESPGWSARSDPGGTITVTTPTGHRYRSDEPRPPHSPPWSDAAPDWAITLDAALASAGVPTSVDVADASGDLPAAPSADRRRLTLRRKRGPVRPSGMGRTRRGRTPTRRARQRLALLRELREAHEREAHDREAHECGVLEPAHHPAPGVRNRQ